MASPVLFLAYGTRRLEVLSSAGFDAVCRQAEAALALHPQSYELYDACGKVDADSFDRSLASSRGLCVLELREKAEWQKMRQMEAQIQQLLESEAAQLKAAQEVEKQLPSLVAAKVDEAMAKLKVELRNDLEVRKTDILEDSSSLCSRVAALETELCELQIDSSGDLGRLEAALQTAQQEMEELRHFTAEQMRFLEQKGNSEAMEEMESLKSKVTALELDLSEQAITNSATNGHLESGVATAKQELESLRHHMAQQLSFVNSKMDEVKEVKEATAGTAAKLERSKLLGTSGTIAWSDGFKSHQLYGKMDKVLWKSAPTLKRPKSLQQLPPLMP